MKFLIAAIFLCLAACAQQNEAERNCRAISHASQAFTVCSFDAEEDIRLHHTHSDGEIIGQFGRLAEEVEVSGHQLVFAMNAGMYHKDRAPSGALR